MPKIVSAAATTREVVGTFADRDRFQAAIDALIAGGFSRGDISILSSHDSLDAADAGAASWRKRLVGLVGEMRYEGPLITAGLIALAAGPVGAVIAGLIAAGVGGAALKELLDEIGTFPDSAGFARALAAGSVILWVAVRGDDEEARASRILAEYGAANVHLFDIVRR